MGGVVRDLPCSPEASFALGTIFLMVSLENAEHGFGSFLNFAGATVGEGLAALLEAADGGVTGAVAVRAGAAGDEHHRYGCAGEKAGESLG